MYLNNLTKHLCGCSVFEWWINCFGFSLHPFRPLGLFWEISLWYTLVRLFTSFSINTTWQGLSLRAQCLHKFYQSGLGEQLIMEWTGHQNIDIVGSYKKTSVGYCNGAQESNTELTLLLTESNSGKVYQYPTAISFNLYQVTYFITFMGKFPFKKS